jgi:hypothetical protein
VIKARPLLERAVHGEELLVGGWRHESRRHRAMAQTPKDKALADIPQRHIGEERNSGGDDARGRQDPKDHGNRVQLENSEAILLVEPFSNTGPHDMSFQRTSTWSPRNEAPYRSMFRRGSRVRKRHIVTLLQNRSAENSIYYT